MALRRSVGSALSTWPGVDRGVPAVLEAVGTALDLVVGVLFTAGPDDPERMVARRIWTTAGLDAAAAVRDTLEPYGFLHGQSGLGVVWSTTTPLLTADLRASTDRQTATALARLGVGAGVGIAAVDGDRVVGVLGFLAPALADDVLGLEPVLGEVGRLLGRYLRQVCTVPWHERLTARELEVLRLAADGVPGPAIARELGVGSATVKTHFEHAYAKLGVADRTAAVARALRLGLID